MLNLNGIGKRFGGLTALDGISFNVGKGSITGIIGPNGAGKTTLFNIATGIYPPSCGAVLLEGKDISKLPPEGRAHLGLVRTFQNIELFGKMTVLENVMVGLHTQSKSGMFACAFRMPWQMGEEKRIRARAQELLEFVGIPELADVEAGTLPFGKGRLLEIARAMALEPKLLLMDEPAAGLNSSETAELADLIKRIRDLGITVALVEHDMDLVMDICDQLVVLNLGTMLAEGTPREIQDNQAVITAYLGEE
ncbi:MULTISPECIES: ABC transporter ATP-binding protein [Citrifermentans]|uniref:Branched-chain amino acid ABC transporter, ATP-binding protein n=1 Tax=Citrifermentans bemidjiense (strain ATCC BAA-1014 / DSM 16622 / JCM 12645 / Bem) TaxID=404380 RepID=B5EDK2_CITBB|nr:MULTISPECIES: ABC transporter ATP-binding protein [Citrifermentans]ACH39198.1 branched-chain amino acid ABC transporter, ATP-binding protein [Citrifermentans bemidjiense Bem]